MSRGILGEWDEHNIKVAQTSLNKQLVSVPSALPAGMELRGGQWDRHTNSVSLLHSPTFWVPVLVSHGIYLKMWRSLVASSLLLYSCIWRQIYVCIYIYVHICIWVCVYIHAYTFLGSNQQLQEKSHKLMYVIMSNPQSNKAETTSAQGFCAVKPSALHAATIPTEDPQQPPDTHSHSWVHPAQPQSSVTAPISFPNRSTTPWLKCLPPSPE